MMSKATPIRGLPPGSAWNEAMRRAMAISIAGFFVPNLLANFGVIPQLHQSFQFMPGICGVVGVFSASMAIFLGYYHHKSIQGTAVAIAGLILPYFSTWSWLRVARPSAGLLPLMGPTAVVAIGTYVAILQWHANLSNATMAILTEQVGADDYGMPKARWERVTIRVFQLIGAVVILLLIFGIFGQGR
jgi:hypothetical protein